jgi:hypothetical protein
LALLAWGARRARAEGKLKWLNQLTGSQKIFGVVAFLLVLLILLNPEFLALGFLGDTAFFDMLVLAIGLQLHTHFSRIVRGAIIALRKTARWAGIPSPGLLYLIAVSTVLIASAVSVLQKAAHRIFS